MLPMIVYLFVVAVGTDYNILLMSRLREETREGVAPREAAARAVEHAGPTVASAAIILAGTFGSLMLTGVDLLSETGFAVAAGIVLVAIVMVSVLVPSQPRGPHRRAALVARPQARSRLDDDCDPR